MPTKQTNNVHAFQAKFPIACLTQVLHASEIINFEFYSQNIFFICLSFSPYELLGILQQLCLVDSIPYHYQDLYTQCMKPNSLLQ